ncbi:uncharacterized protein DUF4132 [Tahibacter aquaticus]|uniref:Uncharacterized protein DUF4132 n=1 Tax=Tahibacter aquaticus TaxID=520092 RepID=A0A4R6YY75_9GAMM|nr:DUF4132 domain-containing protein [Tahibacter aquaticus]TDR43955.1 uncharacterized protein DUF4132 [Tahibacter aquaticus]
MQYIHDELGRRLAAQAVDEATFLAALEDAYREIGMSPALDFAAVRDYWHGQAALPAAWRLALARPRRDDPGTRRWQNPSTLLPMQAWLLPGRQARHWFDQGERAVVLLAPLLVPVCLAELLAPLPSEQLPFSDLADFYAAKGVLQLDLADLYAAKAAALQEWLLQLQTGEGEWAAVAALYRDAGVDTALPARLLAGIGAEQWRKDGHATRRSLILLNQLQAIGLLLREHLHVYAVPDGDWALTILRDLAHLASLQRSYQLLPPGQVGELVLALLRPLCLAAAQAPALDDFLGDSGANDRRALTWTGLIHVLAESPLRWQRFLQQSAPPLLRYLELGDACDFVQRFPAQALAHEQALWARGEWFHGDLLDTPEAIGWYRSILDAMHDRFSFERALVRVARHGDEAQLRGLLQRHVFDRGREMPGAVWALMQDSASLLDYAGMADAAVAEGAAFRLGQLALAVTAEAPAPPRQPHWDALLQLGQARPDLVAQRTALLVYASVDDMARWSALWQASREEASRLALAAGLLDALAAGTDRGEVLALAEQLYAQQPAPFEAHAAGGRLQVAAFCAALQAGDSPLRELIVSAVAHGIAASGRGLRVPAEVLRSALVAFPPAFARLEEKYRLRLLPLFDGHAVAACGAGLALTLREASKTGRSAVRALLARTPLIALQRSGLLDETEARARLVVLTALAQHPAAEALPLIEACIGDAAHDDYSRGLSLDALARSGRSLRGLDDWAVATREEMQALAAMQKIPAALAKAWNDDTARLLAPLGETLGRYLLYVLQQAGEQLPRRARQILALLPPARRSDLAAYGVKTWVAEQGVDKFNWLLLPLPEYADERVVNDLVRGVKAWAGKRKLKAVAALQLLCRVPGDYGVARVRDLWESGKFSPFVANAAVQALDDAAEERGLGREELLEQLVPDFGFTADGLRLELGPYAYTARLQSDFSLLLFDAAGKACKSLPRARAGEDAERRGLAENQLKMLARNLKPLYRQQVQRLLLALQTGRLWSAAQWRLLFAEHALLRVIGQLLVWSAVDADEQSLARFRPSASGELIDASDTPYRLPDELRVRVAHPLEMPPGECAAWTAQFADYELLSPLQQLQQPVFEAQAQELTRARIGRADGCKLLRGRFAALVEKWGYAKDEAADRMVSSHSWSPDKHWHVVLGHSPIAVTFDLSDDVVIDGLRILHRIDQQPATPAPLADLPAALRATLLAQAEALKAAAVT